jgi:mannosyl-3-phosphoglycerate phosphatase
MAPVDRDAGRHRKGQGKLVELFEGNVMNGAKSTYRNREGLKANRKIVVFTDLDSTLLDTNTYSWAAARPALLALKQADGHLVLVSSKTLVEMESLHRALGFADPYVVENGGGIVVPLESQLNESISVIAGCAWLQSAQSASVWPLGKTYEEVIAGLREISEEIGVGLLGFGAMSDADVCCLTGLSLDDARKARTRQFSEPFLITEDVLPETRSMEAAAAKRGLTIVKGGRFWHLMGHEGKGAAVSALIRAYTQLHSQLLTIGLGDSPNDFSFLKIVDVPVLLGMNRRLFKHSKLTVKVRHYPQTGPEAWNQAVLEFLSEEQEELQ